MEIVKYSDNSQKAKLQNCSTIFLLNKVWGGRGGKTNAIGKLQDEETLKKRLNCSYRSCSIYRYLASKNLEIRELSGLFQLIFDCS